ncbi:NirD/YgiW/YdeI family stress tolerance protein [Crocosphaera chwakensis]|uniref:Uncharacterized protein n=1 Tax=Crocosphaera chwakensis CCY0110 TaxID=391612 RepID=A3IH35_9CHRO|nr:NirD/YgiW/YdeI family stress tolerance protein [Crocosphaera chwakensis]EAZ94277.1 hypothetical protein CY0110_10392 [Crocosphaera chwakensis CCY0110]
MKSAIFLTLISLGITSHSLVNAQIPIRELQQNTGISISGEVKDVVGNEFILDDGTGQIIVDVGPRWYHQINVTSGEKITVVGEYDDDDFDAYTIRKNNGEVIQIRQPGSPPPWAGGRHKVK